MNKFLNNSYSDIGTLKKHYKELAFKLHPDMGGSTEDMQTLNAEYERMTKLTPKKQAFEREKGKPEDQRDYKKYEFYAYDPVYVDLIDKLIKLKMQNVVCTVVGFFIYLEGIETKAHKEDLKKIGFKWNGTKKMFYWCPDWYQKKTKEQWEFSKIKQVFGEEEVNVNDNTVRLAH